ncbi:hypothetical protein CA233_22735 [Sphingomonas sp. ABOLD]|nr:hypothetical protein CA233_22735 [Sphingomonas sp. ABOLD]RSV37979.1 hypothetical protein CA234_16855 [Sphingomonas sp. ABOLE]
MTTAHPSNSSPARGGGPLAEGEWWRGRAARRGMARHTGSTAADAAAPPPFAGANGPPPRSGEEFPAARRVN